MKLATPQPFEKTSFIACKVDQVTYAIDISGILEIVQPNELTPLPHAPDFIIGTLQHRNALIPIIDLRIRLGLPTSENTKTKWVLIQLEELLCGVVVDQVYEVFQPREQEFHPAPNRANAQARMTHELVKYGDDVAYLLSLDQLTAEIEAEVEGRSSP